MVIGRGGDAKISIYSCKNKYLLLDKCVFVTAKISIYQRAGNTEGRGFSQGREVPLAIRSTSEVFVHRNPEDTRLLLLLSKSQQQAFLLHDLAGS